MPSAMNGKGALVLLRHGESTLNAAGRFSGWADCPLTPTGVQQAHAAGKRLRDDGFGFDVCFTSMLARAVETASIVMGELGLTNVPIVKTWKLNERHYGDLEGTLKQEAVERYGSEQVEAWRNSADAIPPPLAATDHRHPRFQAAYGEVRPELLPMSESLRDTFERVVEYYESEIRSRILSGDRVLVVSHGNPIRILKAHFNSCPADEIPVIGIDNAMPIFCNFGAESMSK